MHLSHMVGAVAERAESNGWTLDEDGFDDALRDAKRKRAEHYDDRLSACRALRPAMYPAWATLFGEGPPRVTAEHLGAALEITDSTADALATDAVRAGLLEPDTPGCYRSPILSLLAHIADRGREYAL